MDIFNAVFSHPDRYGFRDATSICDTGDCVWCDGIHPAYSMHRFIAEDVAKVVKTMKKGWEIFG
jgi:phospholipase/lecithinase/hemolysin